LFKDFTQNGGEQPRRSPPLPLLLGNTTFAIPKQSYVDDCAFSPEPFFADAFQYEVVSL
jgi:hypothetical protein